MSVAAMGMQQETKGSLQRIEGDLKKFTSCMEKAKKSCSEEESGSCLADLHKLNGMLQNHRDEVRKLTTKAGARQVNKSGLADIRQRIEQSMGKYKEFVNSAGAKVGLARSSAADSESSHADSGSEADSGESECKLCEHKVTVDQLMESDDVDTGLVDEFKCKICLVHVVGCRPVLTSCSHLFCGDCLDQWFAANPGNKTWAQRAKSAGTVPCPVCKEPLTKEHDLHPVCQDGEGGSKFLHQMLSRTRIVCANNPRCRCDGQCNWVGDYGSYQEHIRTCKNLPDPSFAAPTNADALQAVAEPTVEAHTCEVEEPTKVAPVNDVQVSTVSPTSVADAELTSLIGALMQTKARERTFSEDSCSTHDFGEPLAAESSDVDSSEHSEAAEPADELATVDLIAAEGVEDDHDDNMPLTSITQPVDSCHENDKMLQERVVAQQAAAKQWQMYQYQAAQYQAAQYQAAQWQMAQWQMAQWQNQQARATMQWQLAQQQQQSRNAANTRK
jgi:hypothetical protein